MLKLINSQRIRYYSNGLFNTNHSWFRKINDIWYKDWSETMEVFSTKQETMVKEYARERFLKNNKLPTVFLDFERDVNRLSTFARCEESIKYGIKNKSLRIYKSPYIHWLGHMAIVTPIPYLIEGIIDYWSHITLAQFVLMYSFFYVGTSFISYFSSKTRFLNFINYVEYKKDSTVENFIINDRPLYTPPHDFIINDRPLYTPPHGSNVTKLK